MTEQELETIKKVNEDFINFTLAEKYLHEGEHSWDDIVDRIDKTITHYKEEFAKKSKFKYITSDLLFDQELLIDSIKNKRFIPGGSILGGLGATGKKVSLSNCYYIPIEGDSLEDIGEALTHTMRTYSYRGGVGLSLEVLRPKSSVVNNSSKTSTGSVSFMPLFSQATQIIGQKGRRGAQMLSHHIGHPDVVDFIKCKSAPRDVFEKDPLRPDFIPDISGANTSVKLTDDFMRAVEKDKEWTMQFITEHEVIQKTMPARELFKTIAKSTWDYAEPGVLFWNTVIDDTPMSVFDELKPKGVNPCITGDTLISVVGHTGSALTIAQLYNSKNELDYFDVESAYFDTETNRWVNGINKAEVIYSGRKNIIEITCNNQFKLKCTPDHRIATMDGQYVEAQNSFGKWIVAGENGAYVKVVKIEDLDRATDVYDLKVSNHNNFYILFPEGLNEDLSPKYSKLLVHNCGEQILGDWQSCNLASLFLHKYVINPYTQKAEFDWRHFSYDIEQAVIFMNFIIDINKHPLKMQNTIDRYGRKIGLGISGLGDCLAMLNLIYGTEESVKFIDTVMSFKAYFETNMSYIIASKTDLVADVFLNGDKKSVDKYFNHKYWKHIFNNETVYDIISSKVGGLHMMANRRITYDEFVKEKKLANVGLSTIAPNGTISIIADNCTSGLEPLFAFRYTRKTRLMNKAVEVVHPVLFNYLYENAKDDLLNLTDKAILKKYHYVEAADIQHMDRLNVQSTLQQHVTDSISSTINLPKSTTEEEIENIYMQAWKKRLKGVTIYRSGCKLEGILSTKEDNVTTALIEPTKLGTIEKAFRHKSLWKKTVKTYITVTVDENNIPLEVFAKMPKEAGYENNEIPIYDPVIYLERQSYWDSICRLSSFILRLGLPVQDVIKQLEKSSYSMHDLPALLTRILYNYNSIDMNNITYSVCPECKARKFYRANGCNKCAECGYSTCG